MKPGSGASAGDEQPPLNEQPDETAEAGAPPAGEQLVEEELPPGFWEEAQEPYPPSPEQEEQVRLEPDGPPRVEVPASAPGATPPAGQPNLDDPAFATLQALFPGRIISIDAADQTTEEETPVADQGTDGEPETQEVPE